MSTPQLLIYVNNHFDPTWRRAWDRHFEFKGQTFISYADLEEYYLLDNLEIARHNPEYKFEAEFTLVVQKFLERRPELLGELQALQKAGRFGITGGGQVIIDSNMVHGESLVRNYLLGFLWVEETFGHPTRQIVRNDAFGNSAQLPQIARGVEVEWATGMSYSLATGIYWRGLDGSVVVHATLPLASAGGAAYKYPPCPACRGTGSLEHGSSCSACRGRGILPEPQADLPREIHPEAAQLLGAARVAMSPEEQLPNPSLVEWARQHNREDLVVRFALEEEFLPFIRPWLDALDNPPAELVHPGVELNPNNSGVWVTRIKTKQNVRRQEMALLAAETLGVLAGLKGKMIPQENFRTTWRTLQFTQFHDAITATHVDASYAELEAMWAEIDAQTAALSEQALHALKSDAPDTISVFNPIDSGGSALAASQVVRVRLEVPATAGADACPVFIGPSGETARLVEIKTAENGQVEAAFLAQAVEGFSAKSYRVSWQNGAASRQTTRHPAAGDEVVIENERFRLVAGPQGLSEIYDKSLGTPVALKRAYCVGELILEHDEGSPWATLHPDMTRTPLSATTRLARVEEGAGYRRLVFAVGAPFRAGFVSGGLRAETWVTLFDGLPRVDFQVHAHWDTYNHRLRVAFPLALTGKHMYGIPYGMLERQPYEPGFHWASANGDWPAVNWAGVQGETASAALFNRGLPSYRIERGAAGGDTLYLSLLRSPAVPTYLHEPEYYTMTDFDGMRDAGAHTLEFALTAYAQAFAASAVAADAESYNAPMLAVKGRLDLPELPQVSAGTVRISALKYAEQGEPAVIVRLTEISGQAGTARLQLPNWVKSAARVNLLERQAQPLVVQQGHVDIPLRAWEIASLRLAV